MSSVHEIEAAISRLSRQDLAALRDWFSDFDATAWDRQFEADVRAGHLNALADEAIRDLREGRCQDLGSTALPQNSGGSTSSLPRRFRVWLTRITSS